jgi:hypothetical protein
MGPEMTTPAANPAAQSADSSETALGPWASGNSSRGIANESGNVLPPTLCPTRATIIHPDAEEGDQDHDAVASGRTRER